MFLWLALIQYCLAHFDAKEQLRYYEFVQPKIEFVNKWGPRAGFAFERDSRFRMSITAFNRTMHLLLTPNEHLMHPNLGLSDHLLYSGDVYDSKSTLTDELLDHELSLKQDLGWASIMVHQTEGEAVFDGTISFDGTTYTINPIHTHKMVHGHDIPTAIARRREDKNAQSIVYRNSDLSHPDLGPSKANQHVCSSLEAPARNIPAQAARRPLMRRASGCSAGDKMLYMAVAADCTYVARFKTSLDAKKQILRDWNTVSTVYKKNFGVRLGLVEIFAPNERCDQQLPFPNMPWNRPCQADYNLSDRLGDFAVWASQSKHPDDTLWHLVTNCPSDRSVGLAYKGALCNRLERGLLKSNRRESANLAVAVSSITLEPWKVIAHEIGHNFGADHDCDEVLCSERNADPPISCCECSGCNCNGKFLMSPSTTRDASDFSPCSKDQICRGLDIIGTCIGRPDNRRPINVGMCGNGITEDGEDCDCGGVDNCGDNSCCDAKTCKFKQGAVCDDSSDQCCHSCRPKPAGAVCRASRGDCDLEEKCDGQQGTCPDDRFLANGTPCGKLGAQLHCARGQCTSRDLQCQEYTGFIGTNHAQKACPAPVNRCQFLCAASGNKCTVHPGNFAEGTRCGRNLFCRNDQCEGKLIDRILDLAENYLMASILILIGVGFFVISCLLSCVFRGIRRFAPTPPNNSAGFPNLPRAHFATHPHRAAPLPPASLANLSTRGPRPLSRIPLVVQRQN
ncbi:hypothetical protein L0F63_000736 [Massospora cicadina]|nr:hypothetical protein L0F63_000736 [Massospora cicadina]